METRENTTKKEGRKEGRKKGEGKASRQGGTRALRVRAVHTPADGSRVSHATTWRQAHPGSLFRGALRPTAKIIDSVKPKQGLRACGTIAHVLLLASPPSFPRSASTFIVTRNAGVSRGDETRERRKKDGGTQGFVLMLAAKRDLETRVGLRMTNGSIEMSVALLYFPTTLFLLSVSFFFWGFFHVLSCDIVFLITFIVDEYFFREIGEEIKNFGIP